MYIVIDAYLVKRCAGESERGDYLGVLRTDWILRSIVGRVEEIEKRIFRAKTLKCKNIEKLTWKVENVKITLNTNELNNIVIQYTHKLQCFIFESAQHKRGRYRDLSP